MPKVKIYKVDHEEPNDFRWDYIILPYGEYYQKTACLLEAKPGDVIRFFQGREAEIRAVCLVDNATLCNILCKMRYGIPWPAAFSRWRSYAVLEGHGKDILVESKCIIVAFNYICQEKML